MEHLHEASSKASLHNSSGPSTKMSKFRKFVEEAKRIVILTGAGVSAESGIPTFRGAGGFWRTYQAQDLASPKAFHRSPSLVWEFYHYRRELVLTKKPNKAHIAIANYEKALEGNPDRTLTVITQNIDNMHQAAGSKNVVELHGNLFKTKCLKCGDVAWNADSPICPALKDRGCPDPDYKNLVPIPEKDLPRCKKPKCDGLLRPFVVWFGEGLDPKVLQKVDQILQDCDCCLVIGTSSVVYPAAMFAPQLAKRGVCVGEFNIEASAATNAFQFYFEGPCSKTVPVALGFEDEE